MGFYIDDAGEGGKDNGFTSQDCPLPLHPTPRKRGKGDHKTRKNRLSGYILILQDDYLKVTFLNCLTGCVLLHTQPGVLACAQPCQPFVRNAYARTQSSSPQFSHGIELSRALRARSSSGHTDLVEPLSLHEAYLDVTENKTGLPTATHVASAIREQIRQELSLTASAGVAPNKFLAKLASDWWKPDGLFVIQPEEVGTFLLPLRVGRLPGMGKVTEEKLEKLGIKTVSNLRGLDLPMLEGQFGRYGVRLYELSRASITARLSRTGPLSLSLPRIPLNTMCRYQKQSR
jgi:nucleotidyltransferase/DNA polymerase involved in DNA repair